MDLFQWLCENNVKVSFSLEEGRGIIKACYKRNDLVTEQSWWVMEHPWEQEFQYVLERLRQTDDSGSHNQCDR